MKQTALILLQLLELLLPKADATFTDTDASTDLVFKVGTDVADDNAVEKMRLTHDGDLELKQ